MSNLPSQSPLNYKTERGLFHAFVRSLGAPHSIRRVYWLEGAFYVAEQMSPKLLAQFRRLHRESSPKHLEDLIPVGHSRP